MNKDEEIISETLITKECSKISITVMIGNLCLSVLYILAGWILHSMAALSEGVDSLTDAGSSLLLLIGFKISARKPDSLHPNGHKRIEYIIGLLISEIMIVSAVSLVKKSIGIFLDPVRYPVSFILIAVSGIAGLGKLMIGSYINIRNRKYRSSLLKVYYKNMMDDLKGIALAAVATIIQPSTSLPIDAVISIILASIIGYDGLKSFFENVSLLIGEEKEIDKEKHSYAN